DLATVSEKLEGAGIHPDQESASPASSGTLAVFVGRASSVRLTKAVERLLRAGSRGLVADTTRRVVEIDEHSAVGHDVLVLVKATGTRVLHGAASSRGLSQALRAQAGSRGWGQGSEATSALPTTAT